MTTAAHAEDGRGGSPAISRHTGHPTVDAIGELEREGLLYGPIIPPAWNHTILDERGRPYRLAILVLAEIVSWYRPSFDPKTCKFKKSFRHDLLNLSRGWLERKVNADRDTISKVLTFLEKKLGAIERVYRDEGGYRKKLFIRPVPEVIAQLSATDEPDSDSSTNAPSDDSGVAPIMGATSPPSRGPRGPEHEGDVAASRGVCHPEHGGDVAPTKPGCTVSEKKSNKTTTTKTSSKAGASGGADAPVVVVKDLSEGAAAPSDPCRGASPPATPTHPPKQKAKPVAKSTQAGHSTSPATGATRPSAGQGDGSGNRQSPANDAKRSSAGAKDQPVAADASPEADAARRFLNFFQMAHKANFGTEVKLGDGDLLSVLKLMKQGWSVPELAAILLEAWGLIGAVDKSNDYHYPCCQQSRRVTKFVEHFDRIILDTGTSNWRGKSADALVGRILGWDYLDQDVVEGFFKPEIEDELAAEVEPEQKLEDMADPADVSLNSFVRSEPGIPFQWLEKKVLPHLAERHDGELSAGKRQFLLESWKLCKKHNGYYAERVVEDYSLLLDCKSSAFEDQQTRTDVLAVIDPMFKAHRLWKRRKQGEEPTWPIMSNVLRQDAIKRLLHT